jgi:uncharacterized membrane protein YtjA (UPF0391 family)
MIRWSIIFIAITCIAGVLGFTGIILGLSVFAKIIFYIFLVLFVISRIAGVFIYDKKIGKPIYNPIPYQYDKTSEKIHALKKLHNSRIQSLSFQIQLWQGKFRVVKHENNKIRKFNQQLAKENIELETRLTETINQAAKDQAYYKSIISDLQDKVADTVKYSS